MFLAFVALGYLLSDNLNIREELVNIQKYNEQMVNDISAAESERDAAIESLAKSEQTVAELKKENLAQQEQIQNLQQENTILKEQNTYLQNQSKATNAISSLRNNILTNRFEMLFLLPIIPATMAATYVMTTYTKRKSKQPKTNRKTLVKLTDEEVKEIIKIRRNKNS